MSDDECSRPQEWRAAHAAAMVGWDFSALDGRMTADEPHWDFTAECRAAMATATRIADLGTGGGERLIELIGDLGAAAESLAIAATEGWEPNVEIARRNLAPFGVDVHRYDSEAGDSLPFEDASLDLVVCRHESFDAGEVARVLAPGGRFLTQQVDGREAHELREWFGGDPLHDDVTLANASSEVAAAGLRIELADEWTGRMTFADARALVEYMALVPWDVPGFEVDANISTLRRLDAARPIVVTQRRFRLAAVRD
ncbi:MULTISPECIES: class I SAM-dependent methyltransferase [unclassified Pseudoclavibacter]|uniref:class I SAM-dependent methyltransferase n=1 Tax=unclassified Pseudoclavibacter TaxID=2615177 RepID=UPI0021575C2A|nr:MULTISPECIES: class I SAM-dependent methyltransferase [unclassified Pseudoclavibacter]